MASGSWAVVGVDALLRPTPTREWREKCGGSVFEPEVSVKKVGRKGRFQKVGSKDRLFRLVVNLRSTSSFNRARPFDFASAGSRLPSQLGRPTAFPVFPARAQGDLQRARRVTKRSVCAEYAALALRYRFRRLATPAARRTASSSTTTFSNLEGRVRRSTALLRQTS